MKERQKRKSTMATSSIMVFPSDTNDYGTMYGGRLIEMMDMVGGICARRYSGHKAVTASIEDMQFNKPINRGDIIEFTSKVIYTGNTSLVIKTKVTREAYDEDKELCARAYFVFVAMDKDGKPTQVPELVLHTEKDKKNHNIGAEIRKRQALEEKRFEIELTEGL
ncbi:MAG: acyl-CoA thioesterase [Thermodesulfobacteriota bacterium]|jgi:acyl-CoA hydrolase